MRRRAASFALLATLLALAACSHSDDPAAETRRSLALFVTVGSTCDGAKPVTVVVDGKERGTLAPGQESLVLSMAVDSFDGLPIGFLKPDGTELASTRLAVPNNDPRARLNVSVVVTCTGAAPQVQVTYG